MEFLDNFISNKILAHHVNPDAPAGDVPFGDASIDNLVDMVLSGEMPKEKLGDNADQIIKDVLDRRSKNQINPTNFKMPGEFQGTKEEFNQEYGDKGVDNRPNFMEIPVIPFDPNDKKSSKNTELELLSKFTKSMMS